MRQPKMKRLNKVILFFFVLILFLFLTYSTIESAQRNPNAVKENNKVELTLSCSQPTSRDSEVEYQTPHLLVPASILNLSVI